MYASYICPMVGNDHIITLRRWVMASFLGWLAGFVLVLVLSVALGGIGQGQFQFFLGAGMGMGVGLTQQRLLFRQVGMSRRWMWYSLLGMGIPFLAFDIVKQFADLPFGAYYLPVCVITGACLTGVLQVRLLQAVHPRAVFWIPVSMISWTAAVLTVLSIDVLKNVPMNNLLAFVLNILLMLAGGVVLGFLSGFYIRRVESTTLSGTA